MEEFIFEHGLLVLSAWSPYYTHSCATGASNIDVSFVTASLWNSCFGLPIVPGLVTSE